MTDDEFSAEVGRLIGELRLANGIGNERVGPAIMGPAMAAMMLAGHSDAVILQFVYDMIPVCRRMCGIVGAEIRAEPEKTEKPN